MQFRLLGPVEVSDDDGPRAVGGPQLRAVLVALLLRPNQVTSLGSLADAVWDSAPASADPNLRT